MITSTANAQVKALSKLIKNARARRQQQLYVVEGIRMFRETPKERIGKVYVSESFAKDPAHEGVFEGTDWEMLSDSVFAAVSDTKTPQGVLCLVKMKENRLEDMLEEIVGEIRDEYDEEEKDDIRKVNEHEYTVDGTTKLEDIDKLLDLHLESEDYDSIAGHMIHELGHIPTEGEYIDINGIRFTVMKMDKHRVADIDIRLPEAETEQSPSEH